MCTLPALPQTLNFFFLFLCFGKRPHPSIAWTHSSLAQVSCESTSSQETRPDIKTQLWSSLHWRWCKQRAVQFHQTHTHTTRLTAGCRVTEKSPLQSSLIRWHIAVKQHLIAKCRVNNSSSVSNTSANNGLESQ